jgi:hypothetical protein
MSFEESFIDQGSLYMFTQEENEIGNEVNVKSGSGPVVGSGSDYEDSDRKHIDNLYLLEEQENELGNEVNVKSGSGPAECDEVGSDSNSEGPRRIDSDNLSISHEEGSDDDRKLAVTAILKDLDVLIVTIYLYLMKKGVMMIVLATATMFVMLK